MFRFRDSRTIRFRYTDQNGDCAVRTATVSACFKGATGNGVQEEWLMEGVDHDQGALRTYAMAGMSEIVYLD